MGKRKLNWRRQFGQEEVAAELNTHEGKPVPREAKSQKAQLGSVHQHGTKKMKYHKKIT